ncbi:hypothetical protein [Noviherbaspirillum pedocola]|uniref:Uncharacterized protein n=1 Tax=Noviherbaspirillum pedocola TaxID=2801341 RepID=A0A934SVB1_9BURK|nr:hypothetical protein [Noviherbaspirillum pedocola]MBK4735993.1 hypothetical protein [Noviherbaspirillum pedocola]
MSIRTCNPLIRQSDALRIRQAVNNLAIPTDCGRCGCRFTPKVGMIAVVAASNRAACDDCATGAVDVTSQEQQKQNAIDLERFDRLYGRVPLRHAA